MSEGFLFYYSGRVMYVMILKDKSRHEVATEPQLEDNMWVVREDGIAKLKVSASQLVKIIHSDGDPTGGVLIA